MRLLWDDSPLPKGVQVAIQTNRDEDTGRIIFRGNRSIASFFEAIESGTLEVVQDDGTIVAKADVAIEAVNLYAVAESPDDDAVAEVHGSAVGAMPNGGLYA